jgi:hypothetical protein
MSRECSGCSRTIVITPGSLCLAPLASGKSLHWECPVTMPHCGIAGVELFQVAGLGHDSGLPSGGWATHLTMCPQVRPGRGLRTRPHRLPQANMIRATNPEGSYSPTESRPARSMRPKCGNLPVAMVLANGISDFTSRDLGISRVAMVLPMGYPTGALHVTRCGDLRQESYCPQTPRGVHR